MTPRSSNTTSDNHAERMNNMAKINLDDVFAKADLLAYVERAGGKPVRSGSRYACACPLHGGDNPTAFSIYQQGGEWLWKCFTGGCSDGYKRDAISFVQVWQGLDFKQACEWIVGGQIEDAQWMKESAEARLKAAQIEAVAAKEREEARRNELRVAELHVQYHNTMTQFHKDTWTQRGIDEGMQGFWTLGGSSDFQYKSHDVLYHSQTLTIPVFNEARELMTIQHRLLNPVNPKDKYRPEKTGLHAPPFFAVPEMGFDGEFILVMEGAIKAMVTWTRCDSDWQTIGAMSQEMYRHLEDGLKPVGKRVVVIPDPNSPRNANSLKKAFALAKAVGGKFLQLPSKIDDLILSADLKQNELFALLGQARYA